LKEKEKKKKFSVWFFKSQRLFALESPKQQAAGQPAPTGKYHRARAFFTIWGGDMFRYGKSLRLPQKEGMRPSHLVQAGCIQRLSNGPKWPKHKQKSATKREREGGSGKSLKIKTLPRRQASIWRRFGSDSC